MSHTKEPWSFSPAENGLEWGVEAGKWGVAICADAPGDGTSEANARRIVACVNACAGISTDALEIGRMSPDAFHENESRADKAEQQRDELLAAAEAIEINAEECMGFDDFTAMLIPMDDYHRLMEAIASTKGGA